MIDTNSPCLYCGLPLAETGHGRKYHPPCARKVAREKSRLAASAKSASLQGECAECHQTGTLIFHEDGPTDWKKPYNDVQGKYCSLKCFAVASRRRMLWGGWHVPALNRQGEGGFVGMVVAALEAGRLPDKLESLPKEGKHKDVLKAKKSDEVAIRTGSAAVALGSEEGALLDWLMQGRPKHPHNNVPSGQNTVTRKNTHADKK